MAAWHPRLTTFWNLAEPVLKHRMALTFAARADGEDNQRRNRTIGSATAE